MEIKKYTCDKCGLIIYEYDNNKNHITINSMGVFADENSRAIRLDLCDQHVAELKEFLKIKK